MKVTCIDQRGQLLKLDPFDIESVFQKFGNLYQVSQGEDEFSFNVFFLSFTSAFVALKIMHNFSIRHSFAYLQVNWLQADEYHIITHTLGSYHNKI